MLEVSYFLYLHVKQRTKTVHYNQTIAKHVLKSKIRGYSITLGVAPNSSRFCPFWVRLGIEYELTWVRDGIGYEVRVVLGTSWQSTTCLGYDLTGTRTHGRFFCSCGNNLDHMTLTYRCDLDILKIYPHTKRSKLSKVGALQRDRHDCKPKPKLQKSIVQL